MKGVEVFRPFVRNGDFPLEAFTVFPSYSEALDYAYNNPIAFPTQIIGVNNKENKTSSIYKINYDPNRVHRYILERIEIGSGNTIFDFKGSVPTFNDLPKEDVREGEMWLVEDEKKLFVAFKTENGIIEWKELSVSVQEVSRTNDGILSKEVYNTLFNDNNKDAVYFAKKSEDKPIPENNKWINVDHTKKENEIDYSIPSVGMVKEIISGIIEQTTPYIEIVSDTNTENIVDSLIMPELTIIYHKEFGGVPVYATINRYINGINKEEVFSGIPDFKKIENNQADLYVWSWKETSNVQAIANMSVDYEVIIDYDDSIDSNLSAGSCALTKKFYFYKTIRIGTNLFEEEPVFMKKENTISLKYNPNDYIGTDEHINKIYISLPIEATLSSIEFVPQHDEYALDLFKKVLDDGYYKTYEYVLFGNIYFKSPGEFIFKVNL